MFVPLQQVCGFSAFRSGRRGIAGALIGMYLIVCAGVPLPMVRSSSDNRERFPCESCGCGCDSAEHCWRSCCCHTLSERLAWAAKNGVTPPDFVLAEARKAGFDDSGAPMFAHTVKMTPVASSCCASHTCHTPSVGRSCCASRVRSAEDQQHASRKADLVVGWRAAACHGQSLGWLNAVPSLVVVELGQSITLPLAGWLGPLTSERASIVASVPSLPPPERA